MDCALYLAKQSAGSDQEVVRRETCRRKSMWFSHVLPFAAHFSRSVRA
jgi:hypothetical protein